MKKRHSFLARAAMMLLLAMFTTMTAWADDVNLSTITEATTIVDGTTLTGTLASKVKISIADGATVTLSNVTINGADDENCRWAGLTCVGNATIVLEGENTVNSFYRTCSGIQVGSGSGYTLTIQGTGSLNVEGGINGNDDEDCGNIVINSGTITAMGRSYSAGIGSGRDHACGNITINGGTITVTGGTAAQAGIGCGNNGSCGNITIASTITKLTVLLGLHNKYSIGGDNCGTITIGGVETGTITTKPYIYPVPTCTVSFDKNHNDATGTMADQVFSYYVSQTLTPNGFTAPNGYVFVGWDTEADGTGTHYANGADFKYTSENTSTMTLYAQWEQLAVTTINNIPENVIIAGSSVEIPYTVTDNGGATLTEGTDYTAKLGDSDVTGPLNITTTGTYTLTVTGINDYAGSQQSVTFNVVRICAVGNGEENTPFEISSNQELKNVATYVNNGSLDTANKYFKLTTDLDFTNDTYTIIGDDKPFKGTFDGQEHTITGVSLTEENMNMGLFGFNTGTVKNLSLTNSTINNTEGYWYYRKGGIVGYNSGIVENCHVDASVTLYGKGFVGGIAGKIGTGSAIRGCTSAADVASTYGDGYQGGLIGGRDSGSLTYSLYYGAKPMKAYGDHGGGSGYSSVFIHLYNTTIGATYVDEAKAYIVQGDENTTLTFDFYNSTPLQTYGSNNPLVCYSHGMLFKGKYYGNSAIQKLTIAHSGSRSGYTFYRIKDTESSIVCTVGKENIELNNVNAAHHNFVAEWSENIQLDNAASNATTLDNHNGDMVCVTLADRTLYKDGDWNTLCLPFSLSSEQLAASPLAGATIMKMVTLNGGTSLSDKGVLKLDFVGVNKIEAGKPYIVKWTTTGADLENPVFNHVTIDATAPTAVTSYDGNVSFVGTYSPFDITNANKGYILLLTGGGKLGYSKVARTLGSCRAYFETNGANAAREFVIDFGEETTGIEIIDHSTFNVQRSTFNVYDLQGRKVANPTKGLYIVNGRKFIK